jgi:hypothetical protein
MAHIPIRLRPLDAPVMTAPWRKPAAKPNPLPPAAPQPPAQPAFPVAHSNQKKAKAPPSAAPAPKAVEAPPPPPQKKPQMVEVEIIDNGSHVSIPLPYQPVSPLEVLASSNPQVVAVMVRQLRDMTGIQPNTSDGVLVTMDKLADGFKHGHDVSGQMEAVAIHLTGRGDRRELQAELADVLDDERVIEIFKSRSKFEDFLHSCLRRSDITVVEGIAIQAYFNNELDKIFSRRSKRSTGDLVSGREPHELVTKSNLPAQLHRRELQSKFNEASPQEREILRKLGFKIQSLVAAKLTRTTTETVELVSAPTTKENNESDDSTPKPGA